MAVALVLGCAPTAMIKQSPMSCGFVLPSAHLSCSVLPLALITMVFSIMATPASRKRSITSLRLLLEMPSASTALGSISVTLHARVFTSKSAVSRPTVPPPSTVTRAPPGMPCGLASTSHAWLMATALSTPDRSMGAAFGNAPVAMITRSASNSRTCCAVASTPVRTATPIC